MACDHTTTKPLASFSGYPALECKCESLVYFLMWVLHNQNRARDFRTEGNVLRIVQLTMHSTLGVYDMIPDS